MDQAFTVGSMPVIRGRQRRSRNSFALGLIFLLLSPLTAPAGAEMRSVQLEKNLCKTTGGGKFVDVPGFPGEKIDRRLLPDIRWIRKRYDAFLTDGYATSGHSPNGEHPIGLAADLVPYFSRGGSWNKIDKLADFTEPRQDRVRLPWRWVGYDGDSGHGRGHHLHLSWAHSDNTTFGKPARWVLTRKCPGKAEQSDGGGGGDDSGGGIGARSSADPLAGLAPAVVERN